MEDDDKAVLTGPYTIDRVYRGMLFGHLSAICALYNQILGGFIWKGALGTAG